MTEYGDRSGRSTSRGDDVLLRCGACVRTTWTWPQKNRQHRPCCRTPRPAVPVARRLSGFVRLTRSPADARSPARRPPRPRGAAPRVRFSTGLDPGGGPDLAPLDRTSGRGARLTADRSGRWRSRDGGGGARRGMRVCDCMHSRDSAPRKPDPARVSEP